MAKTREPIEMLERLNGGAQGVQHVSACVLDACCSPFPLARYVVGWDAHLIRHAIVYLPAFVVDWAQTLQDYAP